MSSPLSRSKKLLEMQGYLVAIVEHTVPHSFIKRDLFGMFDLLAVKRDETVAVQVTSATNVSARLKKLSDHPNLPRVREANWRLLVHGWQKPTKTIRRWRCRIEDVS